ncbi:hypothetical protein FA95DRAFT_1604954 [Auriscalpium vulgare]|uniref:Uncharacterized protein n=1 Tax=Auriscalpium vulgare TaxID=40419 RepID=A0ACB8RXF3_9AGAM|nr:hypothetical protein FA95DRAFT_1604954 [Auriscalpium vulgare]
MPYRTPETPVFHRDSVLSLPRTVSNPSSWYDGPPSSGSTLAFHVNEGDIQPRGDAALSETTSTPAVPAQQEDRSVPAFFPPGYFAPRRLEKMLRSEFLTPDHTDFPLLYDNLNIRDDMVVDDPWRAMESEFKSSMLSGGDAKVATPAAVDAAAPAAPVRVPAVKITPPAKVVAPKQAALLPKAVPLAEVHNIIERTSGKTKNGGLGHDGPANMDLEIAEEVEMDNGWIAVPPVRYHESLAHPVSLPRCASAQWAEVPLSPHSPIKLINLQTAQQRFAHADCLDLLPHSVSSSASSSRTDISLPTPPYPPVLLSPLISLSEASKRFNQPHPRDLSPPRRQAAVSVQSTPRKRSKSRGRTPRAPGKPDVTSPRHGAAFARDAF